MTVTDTRPEQADDTLEAEATPATPGGLQAYVGSGDHKQIGRLYIVVALLMCTEAVVLGGVLDAERIDLTGYQYFDVDNYFQWLTADAFGLVFLGVLPLFVGLGLYLVPLQVGARTVAFPRAAAASFWAYLLGSVLFVGSYAMNGGPGGGEAVAVDLWILSLGMVIGALLLGSVCIATTVVTLRTPGMSLDRVPPFSWSMLVAGALWLVTLPVLLAVLALAYLDHRYGRVFIGGNFEIYRFVHWSLRQPQVFVYAVPALGIIGEIVATMSGGRQRLPRTMMALVAIFGTAGFGAYTVTIWSGLVVDTWGGATNFAIYDDWAVRSIAALWPLPILLLLAGWGFTLATGGALKVRSSLVLALLAGLLLFLGAEAGAITTIERLGLLETTWVVGVKNLTVLGALVAALGGLFYWSPKIFGRTLSEGAGLFAALTGSVGAALVGLGDLVAGVYDVPDFTLLAANGAARHDGVLEVRDAADVGHLLLAGGWALLALALVTVLLGLVAAAASKGDGVVGDPWDGQTLEWATASPPPFGNFDDVALVTSSAPLLDQRPSSEVGEA